MTSDRETFEDLQRIMDEKNSQIRRRQGGLKWKKCLVQ